MRRMSCLAVTGLVACGTSGNHDRTAFLGSLKGSPEEAVSQCTSIADADLQGECMAGAAVRLAEAGHRSEAMAACAALPPGLWADECTFLVIDALKLSPGADAWDMCSHAGRYQEFCIGHVVTYAIENGSDLPVGIGEETELLRTIQQRVADWAPPAGSEHLRMAIFTGIARILARRWTDKPFDKDECGTASDDLCSRAYGETMRRAVRNTDREAVCAGAITSERVAAANGTPWTPASDAIAQDMWGAFCVGMRGGGHHKAPGPRAPQDNLRRSKTPHG